MTVDAEGGGVTVRVGTTETTFERLVGAATDDVVRGIASVSSDARPAAGGTDSGPEPTPTAADGGVDR